MFNESQLFSAPQFLRVNGLEVNYNEGAFIFMKEKKIGDSRFFNDVSCRILSENMNIVNEKLTYALAKNRLVWLQNDIENSSLHTAIVYENFIFMQEYIFAERCCFLTICFFLKENSENMIFL